MYKTQKELFDLISNIILTKIKVENETDYLILKISTNIESFEINKTNDLYHLKCMDRPKIKRIECKDIEELLQEFKKEIVQQRIDDVSTVPSISSDRDHGENDDDNEIFYYQYVRTAFDEVLPGLFLGSAEATSKYRDKFDCIINCTYELKSCESNSYHVKTNWLDDPTQNILSDLPRLTKYIHDWKSQSKNILIHCNQGVSRSSSLISAYLLTYHNYVSVSETLAFVSTKRPCISPNDGFLEQLEDYCNVIKLKTNIII